jgi:uncharacterized phage infection (PIP) family protein YhgE
MVYTVDGTKSEQTVSAVNIQKAEELIKKQYDGKNVTFTSKQQVKESYSVKEDLKQETPQTANDTGLANMLIHAINGEWETISEYNDILTVIRNNNQFDMIPVIEDILSEENKHVGQLQKILETISGNVEDITEGEQEASEQMSDTTVDDDFGPNSGFDIYLV